MEGFYHAHRVIFDKCNGRMTCMRHCPTQAIRVRSHKAVISDEMCVDCGICISVCPEHAIEPIVDLVDTSASYRYKVAVTSPVLYSQFDPKIHPYVIHMAFKALGFDEVVDESLMTSELENNLVRLIDQKRNNLPLISSHCPAALRLIQVKYPDLVEHIAPLEVPREVVAYFIRREYPQKLGLKPEEIGIFFISPCPAMIVSIKQPAENSVSDFNGAFSIRNVYPLLLPVVKKIAPTFRQEMVPPDFHFSTGWAMMGSIGHGAGMENWLTVSGQDHLQKILDDIENSRLRNIEFVEALSCMLGCIGGPYSVENPYVVRTNNIKQRERYGDYRAPLGEEYERRLEAGYYTMTKPILPRPTKFFDTDLETSIKRMKERERIYQKLPRIDCGACGSPNCMAFAEDVVHGDVDLASCVFFTIPDHRQPFVW